MPTGYFRDTQKEAEMTNPLHAALVQTLEAMKGVLPIVDCDCPDHPDEDFVGWQGSENIPVTFGQVRKFMKAITAAEAREACLQPLSDGGHALAVMVKE